MSHDDLNGNWVGQYTFGAVYGAGFKGKSVLFSIEMTVTDGEIKGNCFDNDHPFDEPATITGSVEHGLISFVKRYPHAWLMDETGKVLMMPDDPSHEVHYSGEWAKDIFTGHWAIIISTDDELVEFGGSGTWSMQRP